MESFLILSAITFGASIFIELIEHFFEFGMNKRTYSLLHGIVAVAFLLSSYFTGIPESWGILIMLFILGYQGFMVYLKHKRTAKPSHYASINANDWYENHKQKEAEKAEAIKTEQQKDILS